jgi:hypothetical protein
MTQTAIAYLKVGHLDFRSEQQRKNTEVYLKTVVNPM